MNIKKLCNEGKLKEALGILQLVDRNEGEIFLDACIHVLQGCTKSNILAEGKKVHAMLMIASLRPTILLSNTMIDMYSKCGSLIHGCDLFDRMQERNVYSWTMLIAGYTQTGDWQKSLKLFRHMQQEGVKPDKVTFVNVLSACASIQSVEQGKRFHANVLNLGHELDVFVGTSLIDLYANCGSIFDARHVFDRLPAHNVFTWTTMISKYSQIADAEEALRLFDQMVLGNIKPNLVSFVSAFGACASLAALSLGKKLHSDITIAGYDLNMVVESAIVGMYVRCACMNHACQVFDMMLVRNIVSWNAMIIGYIQCIDGKSFKLYRQMQHEGIRPNDVTFVNVLSSIKDITSLAKGKRVHTDILKLISECDVFTSTSLLDMYGRCGQEDCVSQVFDRMPTRDIVTWNILISRYSQDTGALKLYQEMVLQGAKPTNITFSSILATCAAGTFLEQGKSIHAMIIKLGLHLDITLNNALIDMYMKCMCIEDACHIFVLIPTQDVVSWNNIIAGYARHSYTKKSIELFAHMQDFVEPDSITFLSALSACINSIGHGKLVHAHILRSMSDADLIVGNAIIDMYIKCGNIERACSFFDTMLVRDIISWSTVLSGCAQHEESNQILKLYEQMQVEGISPNEVTFIGILGGSAAHKDATDQMETFHAEILKFGCGSDLFVNNTLVQMYAQCGKVGDAHGVFNRMNIRNVTSWNAIIAGYAQLGHGKEALQLFGNMLAMGMMPNDASFITVLTACSHTSLVDEGCYYFAVISQGYNMAPTMHHYSSLLDLLGRAGYLDEAEDLSNSMQFYLSPGGWMSLVAACRTHGESSDKQKGTKLRHKLMYGSKKKSM